MVAKINASKVTSGMGFEKVFRNACKKEGLFFTRTDYKNNLPDFLVAGAFGQLAFLECKYYGSQKHRSWKNVVELYLKKQKKQAKAFIKLAKQAHVYFLTVSTQPYEQKARLVLIRLTHDGSWIERNVNDI